jgi:hypothetical protein
VATQHGRGGELTGTKQASRETVLGCQLFGEVVTLYFRKLAFQNTFKFVKYIAVIL